MGHSLRCSKALSRRESEVNAQLSVVPLELCLFALLGESQLPRKGDPSVLASLIVRFASDP